MKDNLKEIRRVKYPIWGERKLTGNLTYLGESIRVEMLVNYKTLTRFREEKDIFYDNNIFYMADNIQIINEDCFKIVLISK